MRAYQKYPRPVAPYYEIRFPYLSQGDIIEDVPFGTLGPELRYKVVLAATSRFVDRSVFELPMD